MQVQQQLTEPAYSSSERARSAAAPWWVSPTARLIRRVPALRDRAIEWPPARHIEPFWATIDRAGGFAFYCDLQDRSCSEVCFRGEYEPHETAIVRHLLGRSMTFVDVGAKWGYFTLLGAHLVSESGRVISIEPDAGQYRSLAGNLAANGLKNVTALPLAAADRNSTLALKRSSAEGGGAELEVAADGIDDILDRAGVESVDLLKMDIRGAETLALRGMARGLKQNRYGAVLLDIHHRILSERAEDSTPLLDLLIECGYHAWRIDRSERTKRSRPQAARMDVRSYMHPLDLSRKIEDHVLLLWLARGKEFV